MIVLLDYGGFVKFCELAYLQAIRALCERKKIGMMTDQFMGLLRV